MAMLFNNLKVTPETAKAFIGAESFIHIMESPGEFLETLEKAQQERGYNFMKMRKDLSFNDGLDGREATKAFMEGKTSPEDIAASDRMMTELEDLTNVKSSKFIVIDDVAGAVPNVPAYLAGHPLTMRRRQRTQSDQAPLMMFVDTAPSAAITPAQMRKKGVAVLALVRLLSMTRPVQLFVGDQTGNPNSNKKLQGIYTRLDTAPLDLARSAFALCGAAYARSSCFEYIWNCFPLKSTSGGMPWAFNNANMQRKNGLLALQQCFPGADIFYVPPANAKDRHLDNPKAWMLEALATYGGDMFKDIETA